jgi:FAD/FMN-containing dehydrogenase
VRPEGTLASAWRELQRAIDGRVLVAGTPDYEAARKPFIARFDDLAPEVVVRCTSPEDVAATISFARRHDSPTAIRSGGHCYAGRSSTRGVLIDVSPMRSVSVSGNEATIGSGAQLGDVYEQLLEHDVTIPAGSCPTVGIAGLSLGGGFGILGRKHGLTCDHLVGARVVLADGRVVDCDDEQHADLFWALRGGGGGHFGVVTSFVFRVIPAPAATNLRLTWPAADAAALIDAWQRWAPTAPDELVASLLVKDVGEADRPPTVELIGAMLGTEADADELLGQFVDRAGREPMTRFRQHMSWRDTRRFWADLGGAGSEVVRHGYRVNKSEYFQQILSIEAITAVVAHFASTAAAGRYRELDFSPWGGAYNRVRPDSNAFAHRDQLFLLKHTADVSPDGSPAEKEAAHSWVARSWATVHPYGSGRVYPNFPDPDLDEWDPSYHGDNYERLQQIKALYDPSDFFRADSARGHRWTSSPVAIGPRQAR